jgi:hypothetical protein
VKLLQGVWTKAGSLLHPGRGSIAAPPARPANGGTLDPSGGSSIAPPVNPTAGATLDPSGGN